jgi:hypothetical protein
MGSRKSRTPGAAPALVAVSMAAVLLAAACGGADATPSPSPATAEPSATASAAPTAEPSPTSEYDAAAAAIIEALGGTIPAGATATVTYGESIGGSPSVHVALGDWQLAWDSKGVLRHVFWEQFTDGTTPPPSAVLTEAEIRTRVGAFVAALHLTISPLQELVDQEGAWMAAWPRVEDGVPVEENGTRFWVNDDGTFLQYTFNWNELGPRPWVISPEQAIKAVEDCQGGVACEASLVWHLPSTGAADEPLVLCWIVGPKGGSGDWRVWVDAGSGEIVDVAALLS